MCESVTKNTFESENEGSDTDVEMQDVSICDFFFFKDILTLHLILLISVKYRGLFFVLLS